jgi:hypothetical protein
MPHGPPIRIIIDVAHQPGPERITDQVIGGIGKRFVGPQRMIMKAMLPHRARSVSRDVDLPRRASLKTANRCAEIRIRKQLQQPVHVIWHDNMSEADDPLARLLTGELPHHDVRVPG